MDKLKTKAKFSNQAFTLVELVIVIVILAILWAIAFISLSWYSTQARDSARISDISSIRTSIELFHLDAWKYPIPTEAHDVFYSWSIVVWKQWTFWETAFANTNKLDKIPVDPLVEKEYTYSVTAKWNEFQLWWIMEWDEIVMNSEQWIMNNVVSHTNAWEVEANAYVAWNYNWLMSKVNSWTTCEILSVPSIISNDDMLVDLESIVDMNAFVYGWYNNLPSSFKSSKFKHNWWFPFQVNKLVAYTDTGSCADLYDATNDGSRARLLKWIQDSYFWTVLNNQNNLNDILSLNISTNNPSKTVKKFANNFVNVTMWWGLPPVNDITSNYCSSRPNYTNATYNDGLATQENQLWQSIDSNAPCYWTCGSGNILQWNDCLSTTASGTPPNWTSTISNATSVIGWTWHYSVTPGVATYICNPVWYSWNGTNCVINNYTVSWSFWAWAAWATIDVCWTAITADWSWNFTSTRTHGSSCNNITATRTWYNCATITNGPLNLSWNISNVSWNCVIKNFLVAWNIWTLWNWATVNVCWVNTTANTSGWFSAYVNYGSNCSAISATKAGATCSITTNWPASLTDNVSGISWSCVIATYTVSNCSTAWQILNSTSTYPWVATTWTQFAHPSCNSNDIIVCTWNATWYVVSACNIWTWISWTGSTSKWYWYQFWRNKWFIYSSGRQDRCFCPLYNNCTCTMPKAQHCWTVASSDPDWFVWTAKPGQINAPYNWSTCNTQNNWKSNSWPCASGYHVPSTAEWTGVLSTWFSNVPASIINGLKIPNQWYLSYQYWNVQATSVWYYWSNDAVYTPNWIGTSYINSNSSISVAQNSFMAQWLPVRCFKD